MDNTTLIILIIIILFFVFGGGWYGRGRWYYALFPILTSLRETLMRQP